MGRTFGSCTAVGSSLSITKTILPQGFVFPLTENHILLSLLAECFDILFPFLLNLPFCTSCELACTWCTFLIWTVWCFALMQGIVVWRWAQCQILCCPSGPETCCDWWLQTVCPRPRHHSRSWQILMSKSRLCQLFHRAPTQEEIPRHQPHLEMGSLAILLAAPSCLWWCSLVLSWSFEPKPGYDCNHVFILQGRAATMLSFVLSLFAVVGRVLHDGGLLIPVLFDSLQFFCVPFSTILKLGDPVFCNILIFAYANRFFIWRLLYLFVWFCHGDHIMDVKRVTIDDALSLYYVKYFWDSEISHDFSFVILF